MRLFVAGLEARTSTNAESLHYSDKYGFQSVNASMSATTSCNVMSNKAETRAKDMAKNFAQKASKNSVQEDSTSREFLTPWAEEFVVKQRSQQNDYWIVQLSRTKFIMMKPKTKESEEVLKLDGKGLSFIIYWIT